MTDQPSQPVPPEAAALSRIVIATGNPHKVEELSRLLALPGVEFVGLKDLPGHESFTEPEEVGDTFEANATIKARSYAAQTGLPCLADDSGLAVGALGGAPGVISSHYCTDGREVGMSRAERDAANNAKLLRELEGVPAEERSARFVCVMVLAGPRGTGFQPVRPAPSDMTGINLTQGGTLNKSWGDLPHWHKDGSTYFVTFRARRGERLAPSERELAMSSCLYWHKKRALVHLAVIMHDHVHLLVSPLPRTTESGWHELPALLHSIKSHSANQIMRARGDRGALWQPEYFDRIVRDSDEFERQWEYMLHNPVKAGLVGHWSDYRWTRSGPEHAEPHRLEAGATAGPAILSTSRGTFEGRIGLPGPPPSGVPRGTNGFGYDPLFLVGPECRQTGAELSTQEKNRQSHRAVAAGDMLQQLRAHLRHA